MTMVQEGKIYLKQETIKLGFGSTARTTTIENYYQVDETQEPGRVRLRLLDIDDRPLAGGEIIDQEELEKEYVACPDYLKNKRNPRQVRAEEHVKNGEKHLEKREFYTAEREFDRALFFNQENLRANLGKGKTLFALGQKEEGRKVFEKLSQLDHLYESENKHIFNEFGIELRKRKLFEEAVSNYEKALAIDPEDAVLYYNLGRAWFEKGDPEAAGGHLQKALELKPDFQEAREFLVVVNEAGASPSGREKRTA